MNAVSMLNDAITKVAENVEDVAVMEDTIATLELCRSLVEPSDLQQALSYTTNSATERRTKEREVVHASTEFIAVRRMA